MCQLLHDVTLLHHNSGERTKIVQRFHIRFRIFLSFLFQDHITKNVLMYGKIYRIKMNCIYFSSII